MEPPWCSTSVSAWVVARRILPAGKDGAGPGEASGANGWNDVAVLLRSWGWACGGQVSSATGTLVRSAKAWIQKHPSSVPCQLFGYRRSDSSYLPFFLLNPLLETQPNMASALWCCWGPGFPTGARCTSAVEPKRERGADQAGIGLRGREIMAKTTLRYGAACSGVHFRGCSRSGIQLPSWEPSPPIPCLRHHDQRNGFLEPCLLHHCRHR